MDNHEKMRQMHSELVDMADRLDKMGDLKNLMDTLLDDGVWQRGVLFGMVRAKLDNAETLVRSVICHIKYHIDEAKRGTAEAVEGDGA
jgi:hypothetical protein